MIKTVKTRIKPLRSKFNLFSSFAGLIKFVAEIVVGCQLCNLLKSSTK